MRGVGWGTASVKTMNKLLERAKALEDKYRNQPKEQGRKKLRETYPQIADFIELVELHFGKVTGKVKKVK